MIERYIEITFDVCGEPEWTMAGETIAEFRAGNGARWKHRGRRDMCPACVARGAKWSEATIVHPIDR